jgi:hypothetical protein
MFSSFFIEGSLILHHIRIFKFLKRLSGVKKRRQKRDGSKRPKNPYSKPTVKHQVKCVFKPKFKLV